MGGKMNHAEFRARSFAFRKQSGQGTSIQSTTRERGIQSGFRSNQSFTRQDRCRAHPVELFSNSGNLFSVQVELFAQFQNVSGSGATIEFGRKCQPPTTTFTQVHYILR